MLDREYQRPLNENFKKREFSGMKWPNSRSKNFFTMIKVLCEHGYCTVSDIVANDGFSQKKKQKKKRHDEYNRLITAKNQEFQGLIEKRLLEPKNPDWQNTKNNKYRLSIFGLFYGIHLFSENFAKQHSSIKYDPKIKYKETTEITKYKDTVLDDSIKNYSDVLSLIFGKWTILTEELGSLVNVLLNIAHLNGSFDNEVTSDYLFSLRPITMTGWKGKQGIYSDELTVLFYSYQCLHNPHKFIQLISKDKDIYNWYRRFLKFLYKANREERLRVKFAQHILKKEFQDARKTNRKLCIIQGLDPKRVAFT